MARESRKRSQSAVDFPLDPPVLGLLVANWLDGLKELGFDPGPLIEGVVDRRALAGLAARTRWSVTAEILDRAVSLYGREVVERAGEVHVVRAPIFQAVARTLVRPATIYAALASSGRHVWPLEFPRFELLGREFFSDVRVPDRQRPCEGWFITNIGVLRSLPRLVGLPDGEVDSSITTTEGRFRVVLPPEALFQRQVATGRAESVTTILRILEPLGRSIAHRIVSDLIVSSSPPDESQTLVLDLQRQFALTRSEARVAARVASGLSVREIARALRVREATVHVHLRSTFKKVGVRRQAELVALVRARPTPPTPTVE